ncbi:MAG: hypothetical protein WCT37_04750 [Patescibacteria group bacterium]|jgi:hypothetical protein
MADILRFPDGKKINLEPEAPKTERPKLKLDLAKLDRFKEALALGQKVVDLSDRRRQPMPEAFQQLMNQHQDDVLINWFNGSDEKTWLEDREKYSALVKALADRGLIES